jgi:hypothetical protein
MKVKIIEEVGSVAGVPLLMDAIMEVDEKTGQKMVSATVAEAVEEAKEKK